ncbi:NAD(P)-binding protein [Lepidopterella palustris CBS 459.81]|uniref:NAD(P)-binding protein n=1 Tax=Lepidopterella palustris CBS 459.81 TaxID=1314670 RepID=A0A8E2DWT9_9PEZI|nr:NAD(P)-binding protein [Lepidopterella palustris CBS 459.81]
MALLVNILAGVGLFAIIYIASYPVRALYEYFIRPSSLARYLSEDVSHPSWALVTGSTDGIGLGFAHELCARGFNILLHGRNVDKLQRVKAELLAAFPSRSVTIATADASKYDDAGLYKLAEQASNLPDGGRLRVLVNNVGGAHNVIGKGIFHLLADTTGDEIDTLINVNIRFPARLTAALLPALTSKSNLPSLIINLGSIAGVAHNPYLVVYSAAKAFNLSFSAALGKEMKAEGHNVEVLGFVIGSVDTPGAPAASQGGISVMTPRQMAQACLNRSGCGKWILEGTWSHWSLMRFMNFVPDSIVVNKLKELYLKEKRGK